jgi:hypothetical protein
LKKDDFMQKYREREEYDLEIDLTLLTREEGGRMYGIRSGYRCVVAINRIWWTTEFHLSDQDREDLNPGETCKVLVYSIVPGLLLEHLTLETPLLLSEGGRIIGRGRILEFLNLEKHAEQVRQENIRHEEEVRRQKAAAQAKKEAERLARFQTLAERGAGKAALARRKKAILAKREKGRVQQTKKTQGNRSGHGI